MPSIGAEDDDEDFPYLSSSSNSFNRKLQRGYDAEYSSSDDEDDSDSRMGDFYGQYKDSGDGEGKSDSFYDESEDKTSSNMNDESDDKNSSLCSDPRKYVGSNGNKRNAGALSTNPYSTGGVSASSRDALKRASVVKYQQNAMAKPLMKRFRHENTEIPHEECKFKLTIEKQEMAKHLSKRKFDDSTKSFHAAPAGGDGDAGRAPAPGALESGVSRESSFASSAESKSAASKGSTGEMQVSKRSRHFKKDYIQKQQHDHEQEQDRSQNSAQSFASSWSSSMTTMAAASSATSSHRKKKRIAFEMHPQNRGDGSSASNQNTIATLAAPTVGVDANNNTSFARMEHNSGKTSKLISSKACKKSTDDSVSSMRSKSNDQHQGYPYFGYKDHSLDNDDEPLVPLVPPSRVATFPIKMHVILSRPDLTHTVRWMHHGRSWRLVDPVEFEMSIIPTYFGHASLASFMRQVNGWGFKRITKGRDKNSYYHPLFLRGLPHLSKRIPQPGISRSKSEKINRSKSEKTDPSREPDFAEISKTRPLPAELDPQDVYASALETIRNCIIKDGPKARMPVVCIDVPTRSEPTPCDALLKSSANDSTILVGGRSPSNAPHSAITQQPLPAENAKNNVTFPFQLQQQQQQQHYHHQQENQQQQQQQLIVPNPARDTLNQQLLLQQLQMMTRNPSFQRSHIQAPQDGNVLMPNNWPTVNNNNGAANPQLDPRARAIAHQILPMRGPGRQDGSADVRAHGNAVGNFNGLTSNSCQMNIAGNTVNNMLQNPMPQDNNPALANQIMGILLQNQSQQQQQHRQQNQQPSIFNEVLMRAAIAGTFIGAELCFNGPNDQQDSQEHKINDADRHG